MDTTDFGVALVSPAANAVDVNTDKISRILNAKDKKLFLIIEKPPLFFVFIK